MENVGNNINWRSRMDFKTEITNMDEEKGTFKIELIPDPRRYEWRDIDGEKVLYDKFDNCIFTKEALNQLMKASEVPMYFERQEIDDSVKYVESRKPIIKSKIKGKTLIETFEDKSEAFLESLKDDKLAFVILCVDIVGSTKLSTTLDSDKYAKIISLTLDEISEVVPIFHGHVLKYTGDGLIAYFPEPSFIRKNDLAIDCALTIRLLIYSAVNSVFKDEELPKIDIRIGLDSGEACIVVLGSKETKRQKDIIGKVVSLASKIQSKGNPGDILIGGVTERNLHTSWRQMFYQIKLGEDWQYKSEDGEPYKVYKFIN